MPLCRCSPMQLVWISGRVAALLNAHGGRQIVAGRFAPAFFAHLRQGGIPRTLAGRVAALLNAHGGRRIAAGRLAPAFFAHLRQGGIPLTLAGRVAPLLHSHGGRRIVAGRLAPAFFARIRKMLRCPTPTARTALSPPLLGALPVRRLRQGIASALSCDFAREDSRRIQVGMA